LPDESFAVERLPSSNFHHATRPGRLPGLTVREMVVGTVAPAPAPVTTILKMPIGALEETESVRVVEQVAVQVAAENEAVTPEGKEDAVKLTEAGLPASNAAVIVSVDAAPRFTSKDWLLAETVKEDGRSALTVVRIASADRARVPLTF